MEQTTPLKRLKKTANLVVCLLATLGHECSAVQSNPPSAPSSEAAQDTSPAKLKHSAWRWALGTKPTANAGQDQAAKVGDKVTLDGLLSSDPDKDPLRYFWTFASKPDGSQATLSDPQTPAAYFFPDVAGIYLAQLIVNDGTYNSDPATATVTVTANHAPAISSQPVTQATVGQLYSYQVTATDQDNDSLQFSLALAPDGMAIDPASGLIAWTPAQTGTQTVTVKAQDPRAAFGVQTFDIDVQAVAQLHVPDLVGQTRSAAETLAQQAKLNVASPVFEHNSQVAAGNVIRQSPAANAWANLGDSVALTVSLGPDTGLPPNPAVVAPPVDQTVATTVADATKFLYSGANAVQTGVAEGAIETRRAAVIRGRLLDKAGNPLPGVTVTINGHAELGQTLSRDDGGYDLAVNGGGYLSLNYQKTGYLPAQRQVNVGWQEYESVEDTVLIGLDAKATTIDLTAATPMQVAQGSPVTDKDGTRQATLMIPQGTQAQVYNADGSLRTTNTLNLRLTEYTVGDNGPASMPGPLPPTSGYTYAVELKADEAALKFAGKDVLFDRPVPFYVDNFLNFPAGTVVPVGYYDTDKKAWIPSDSGLVIKIVSITGGLADVDGDGDNAADDAAKLAALGMTDAEREKLAATYAAGKSLWRVQVNHLSTWDLNWPFGPPAGAIPPNPPEPPKPEKKPADPDCSTGSIIQCQNQALGESIPINGTPFNLHYQSDRMPGRKSAYAVDIPLSGASLPASLKGIVLETSVAGTKSTQTFAASPNLRHSFVWNGQDAYGRVLVGKLTANIRIGFVYDGSYQKTDRFGYNGKGVSITGDRARQQVTLWRDAQVQIGSETGPSSDVSGWSLSIHHAYDPLGKTLYLGNGDLQNAQSATNSVIERAISDHGGVINNTYTNPAAFAAGPDGSLYITETHDYFADTVRRVTPDGVIKTIAGNGQRGFSGDGGPAINASFSLPYGIAVAADGSLYIADSGNFRIRRISPDGIINTVAGNGQDGFSGDGGPAVNASFGWFEQIALSPDGTLYIADWGNSRIRRVGLDGVITTIAGGGTDYFNPGDGGPATKAVFSHPNGVAAAPDGSLYIAEDGGIRRVGTDGIINTVAGGGKPVDGVGDGGPGISAHLAGPRGLVFDPRGNLYIAETGGSRIRKLSPDGTISTVAGNGYFGPSNFGIPPTARGLFYPSRVAVAPDGTVYTTEGWGYAVFRIRPSLPGVSVGETLIPSQDGAEAYYFDAEGRHLRTIDLRTKAVLYSFGYDSAGHLLKITDVSGNITKIERDALGNPTAIVAPFGQRTELALDANGYLATVKNPAGETHAMTYTADGLMTQFKKPKGNTSTLVYDDMGRLTSDQDAASGSKNLARTAISNGYEVALTTGLNRKTTYRVENLPTGDERRTRIEPDGTQTVTLNQTNGTTKTTEPDGTVTTQVKGPDPRFGMLAPLAQSYSIASGGLTFSASQSRTATLSNSNDPLSLTQQTDTVKVNGRTSTRVYDAATSTTTVNSAAGRVGKTTLDAKGRLIKTEITGLQAIQQSYDAHGHLTTVAQGTGADQRALAFAYNDKGWLKSVTDPLNRSVNYEYDLAGRVTRQVLPDGRDVLFGYDANGNLTSLTPPGQPAHLFKYTNRDQTQEYGPPAASNTGTVNTLYEYNLDKELTKITRPDGLSMAFTYDNAGRLNKLTTPDGDTGYAYADTGKLASITIPDGGKLAYSYTGALLTETAWTGAVAGKVGYAYDNDFRAKTISVNGANAITYSFDADSLLTQAGDLALTRSAQNGLLTGTALGKLADSLSYNSFGELARYEAKIDGASLFKTDYTRDKLGRITRKVETLGATVNTYDYGYDTAGRLIQVSLNGAVTSQYAYDDNGNRLSRTQGATVTQGSYDAQDRLLTYGNASYAYTANGELKTKTVGGQTTSYVYDVPGNLRIVTLSGGGVIDYLNDGQNRRIGKKLNGVLVQGFLWQDQLKPIAELDGSGNIVSRFVYATGVNVPDYMVKGGVTYRLVKDHLGSPRYVVNVADGTVIQQMDYDEFGNVLLDTNPGFQPFGFAGGLYDRDTGLVRFGARDYEAGVGRWISKDPIGFGGWDGNLFGYVFNDPINASDKTGRSSKEDCQGPPPPPIPPIDQPFPLPPIPPIDQPFQLPDWLKKFLEKQAVKQLIKPVAIAVGGAVVAGPVGFAAGVGFDILWPSNAYAPTQPSEIP